MAKAVVCGKSEKGGRGNSEEHCNCNNMLLLHIVPYSADRDTNLVFIFANRCGMLNIQGKRGEESWEEDNGV